MINNIAWSIREKGSKPTQKSTSAAAAFQGARFRGAVCPSGKGGGLQVSWAQQVLCYSSIVVTGCSWWFCLLLSWSSPGAASTPSLRYLLQCSSVLRAGTLHWPRQSCVHLAELLLALLAAVSDVSLPQGRFLLDAAAACGGVAQNSRAAGFLHVPTKARFTQLSLSFAVSKQPVACFWQWPGCVSWATGKQTPSATPGAWAVTHESSKDMANPPVAQGSSPGPSSWSCWRHLLFPTWSCLVWVWGRPVALDLGTWLLLGFCNIL